MRGDHDNFYLVFAGLHLLDLHSFRKWEQRVSFHHNLVSPGKIVKQALLERSVSYLLRASRGSFVGKPAKPVLNVFKAIDTFCGENVQREQSERVSYKLINLASPKAPMSHNYSGSSPKEVSLLATEDTKERVIGVLVRMGER
jgi:hypothetical protein